MEIMATSWKTIGKVDSPYFSLSRAMSRGDFNQRREAERMCTSTGGLANGGRTRGGCWIQLRRSMPHDIGRCRIVKNDRSITSN